MENKKNKKFLNFNDDDEWYTLKEDIYFFLKKSNISKDKIIWCPFDLEDSNFVMVLKELKYKVVYSHINDGKDFYKYEPKKWDVIISNPPFKNKHNLLVRLLEFNKPFALIFGIQALNSEKFCSTLQKFKKIQYIHLSRRICFTKDYLNYDIKKLQRPSFASMWICNDLFNKDIQFWDGVNHSKK